MTELDALPPRPLTEAELAALNRADAVDLAVDVTEAAGGRPDSAAALLVATDEWVAGLVAPAVDPEADGGATAGSADEDWRIVERVSTEGDERFDGLERCEAAVREVVDGTDP